MNVECEMRLRTRLPVPSSAAASTVSRLSSVHTISCPDMATAVGNRIPCDITACRPPPTKFEHSIFGVRPASPQHKRL